MNISNGLYDKEYIEKYTTGFDKLKEYIHPFTPEWAYGITTLDPMGFGLHRAWIRPYQFTTYPGILKGGE